MSLSDLRRFLGGGVNNLELRIRQIAANKIGNRDLAIFYDPDSEKKFQWAIHLGNNYKSVGLGEVDGQIIVSSESLEDAVTKLAVAVYDYNETES